MHLRKVSNSGPSGRKGGGRVGGNTFTGGRGGRGGRGWNMLDVRVTPAACITVMWVIHTQYYSTLTCLEDCELWVCT